MRVRLSGRRCFGRWAQTALASSRPVVTLPSAVVCPEGVNIKKSVAGRPLCLRNVDQPLFYPTDLKRYMWQIVSIMNIALVIISIIPFVHSAGDPHLCNKTERMLSLSDGVTHTGLELNMKLVVTYFSNAPSLSQSTTTASSRRLLVGGLRKEQINIGQWIDFL
ncbi:hypothetical protein AVEN_188611-1 [Araneus ventricosus]|uniref:Uncharacterized protein n=1 Tax=Araneus ventricosus TaxID=182803 RepID=A0A4Y2JMQ0_ARAVE|nr:hypothetical protein AVEN_188611-1 [Araneus ventricosus]